MGPSRASAGNQQRGFLFWKRPIHPNRKKRQEVIDVALQSDNSKLEQPNRILEMNVAFHSLFQRARRAPLVIELAIAILFVLSPLPTLADTDQIARDLAWLCFEGTTVERLGKLYKSANSLANGDPMKEDLQYVVAAGLLSLGEYDRFIKLPKSVQDLDPLLELYGICGACNGKRQRSGSCNRCKTTGKCPVCKGRGNEHRETLKGTFIDVPCKSCGKTGKCPACHGRGSWSEVCPLCQGSGEGPAVGFSRFAYQITLAYMLLDYYKRSSYANDMVAQKKVLDFLRAPGIKESDFCFSCGQFFYGASHYTISTTYGEKAFCTTCSAVIQNNRGCFVCKRTGRFEVEPGVFLCKKCSHRRVGEEDFNAVLADVIQRVSNLLGGTLDFSQTEIVSVSYKSLQEATTSDSDVYGKHSKTALKDLATGKIVDRSEVCTIRVAKNLPIDQLRDVLAHEIGHHWLHQNVRGPRSKKEEEGFAEWVASLVDRQYESYMLYWAKEWSTDPTYGDGYRMMKERINAAPDAPWASYFHDAR